VAKAAWWKGERGEWYVVAQVFLFVLVAVGPNSWPGWPAWPEPVATMARGLGILFMLAGAGLAIAGVLRLGSNLTPLPYPRDGSSLIESGPYAIVRNPIYSGLIFGALGWGLWRNGPLTIVYALALFVFFDVKSRLEERWLAEKFGDDHADYRSRVKKLIPWVY
jgi:protein-S-isoprenylcysteine O-methyltransferase Ste14